MRWICLGQNDWTENCSENERTYRGTEKAPTADGGRYKSIGVQYFGDYRTTPARGLEAVA